MLLILITSEGKCSSTWSEYLAVRLQVSEVIVAVTHPEGRQQQKYLKFLQPVEEYEMAL